MGEQLDRTIQVVGELRQVLTEGRALLKDLQRERKAVERSIAAAQDAARQAADQHVDERVEPFLEDEFAKLQPFITDARDSLLARIDAIADEYFNLYRFGNKQGRGDDLLAEAALRANARDRRAADG